MSLPCFFAIVYVPSELIVHGNAAAANNIVGCLRDESPKSRAKRKEQSANDALAEEERRKEEFILWRVNHRAITFSKLLRIGIVRKRHGHGANGTKLEFNHGRRKMALFTEVQI
jgi:hypothetical protein